MLPCVNGTTSGQGEIRTHGTLAGTPVFETGAFNHSATCPEQPSNLPRERGSVNEFSASARSEEVAQQCARLHLTYTALHFRTMIEPRVAQQVSDRAGHPCFRVPRTEHNAVHA